MATSVPPIPRIELASAPTPLLKLERLSAELGVELWGKRDDLTGLLETGNKIRKLEFLVGEALAQKADTLITCGTLQSNCCRCVAAVCARLGLRAVLALKGEPPAEYDGNLLLDRLLGADIHYCTDAQWAKIDETLEDLAARERAQGRTPYVIPESGATVVGALGPVYTAKAFTGLLDALRRAPRALGRRVCFVHTGGVFSVFPYRAALSRLVDGDGLVES